MDSVLRMQYFPTLVLLFQRAPGRYHQVCTNDDICYNCRQYQRELIRLLDTQTTSIIGVVHLSLCHIANWLGALLQVLTCIVQRVL